MAAPTWRRWIICSLSVNFTPSVECWTGSRKFNIPRTLPGDDAVQWHIIDQMVHDLAWKASFMQNLRLLQDLNITFTVRRGWLDSGTYQGIENLIADFFPYPGTDIRKMFPVDPVVNYFDPACSVLIKYSIATPDYFNFRSEDQFIFNLPVDFAVLKQKMAWQINKGISDILDQSVYRHTTYVKFKIYKP